LLGKYSKYPEERNPSLFLVTKLVMLEVTIELLRSCSR